MPIAFIRGTNIIAPLPTIIKLDHRRYCTLHTRILFYINICSSAPYESNYISAIVIQLFSSLFALFIFNSFYIMFVQLLALTATSRLRQLMTQFSATPHACPTGMG